MSRKRCAIGALDVAGYLLDFQREEPSLDISHLKLQKLVFYCQAFHLAINEAPLFDEKVVAWPYGPVILEVYKEFRSFSNHIIPPSESTGINENKLIKTLSADGISVISGVLKAYGHLAAIALMEQTHQEEPWQQAFKQAEGAEISQSSMKKFYKTILID